MNRKQPIGVFDSGLGGLTVLRSLQKKLPNESFIYIGDMAHVPYGNKSDTAIIDYSTHLSHFLINNYNVKMIIVACNTASSITLSNLRVLFNVPILDVITPMEILVANHININRIGIIGTHNTIQSQSYEKLLLNKNSSLKIFSKACPLFVPIIEEGLADHKIAQLMSKEYLSPLIKKKIEALILGCTHYPIMKKTIQSCLDDSITIFDSADILATYTSKYLQENNLFNLSNSTSRTELCITDSSEHFNRFAHNILNNNFIKISTIQLFK